MANVRLRCEKKFECDVLWSGWVGDELVWSVVWFNGGAETFRARLLVVEEGPILGDGRSWVANFRWRSGVGTGGETAANGFL